MTPHSRMERIAIAGTESDGAGAGHRIVDKLAAICPDRIVLVHPDGGGQDGFGSNLTSGAFEEPVDLLISLLPANKLVGLLQESPVGCIRNLLALPDGKPDMRNTDDDTMRALAHIAGQKGITIIDPVALQPPAHRLEALFRPQSIAIAGASNSEGKIGNQIMKRLMNGYGGRLHPIHPTAPDVLGVPAVSAPADLGDPVDLLIALLPGERLIPLVESCAPGQFKYLLAVPSGFGEVEGAGNGLQSTLVTAARQRGMRVVGPNCMGLVNAAIGLNASLVPDMPEGGQGISFLTQSGGFGIATTMYALDHALQVAAICDLGNTCDLAPADVMDYLAQDVDTLVACILLECIGQTPDFLEALSELASRKPVVVTLPGGTSAGSRASKSHLGLVPVGGIAEEVAATGAIVAETCRDLHNIAKALAWQPMPWGPRLAIVTGTGGIGVELADLAQEYGLEVPELPKLIQQAIAALLPDYAGVTNPVDLTPIYAQYASIYPEICRLLMECGEIDQIILSVTDVATGRDELAVALVDMMKGTDEKSKPVYVFWGARWNMVENRKRLEQACIPCFSTTLETIRTVSAICNRGTRNTGAQKST